MDDKTIILALKDDWVLDKIAKRLGRYIGHLSIAWWRRLNVPDTASRTSEDECKW